MPAEKPRPPDDPAQSQRFMDMADEIGADADEEAFARLFGRVVKAEPVTQKPRSAKSAKPDGD